MVAGVPAERAEAGRRNNIGTLRLAGALAVLFGHSFALTAVGRRDPLSNVLVDVTPYRLGLPGLGVAMFFVISGYLVTRSFVRRGNLAAYAEARALRIFPALWCAVLVVIVLGAFVSTYGLDAYAHSKQTLQYGLHGASLIHLRYDLPGVFAGNPLPSVNGSLWTLPVELRMYVLVAIAGVAGLLGRRALFNLTALAIVAVTLVWPDGPLLAKSEHEQLAVFFLAGATLYINRDWLPLTARGVVAVAAVALLASPTAAFPLAFAFAFAYAVMWFGLHPGLRVPDLAARGDLSYATYLYAFPATQLWIYELGSISPWPLAGLTLITVLPLAWLSWHLVEEPALRLKGRLVPASALRPRRSGV